MEQQLFPGASFSVHIRSNNVPYGLIKYPNVYCDLLFTVIHTFFYAHSEIMQSNALIESNGNIILLLDIS